MPKDALYFSHDFGARNDPKLQEVQMQMGMEGIGIYWCVVEMLYEQGGYLPFSALRGMAYALHTDEAKLRQVIEGFDLFGQTDDGRFYSHSVNTRIERKRRISEARREAGRLGGVASGQARSNSQANASQDPDLFAEQPEAPVPVGDQGDTAVADMIIARSGPSTQATLQSYTGPTLREGRQERPGRGRPVHQAVPALRLVPPGLRASRLRPRRPRQGLRPAAGHRPGLQRRPSPLLPPPGL